MERFHGAISALVTPFTNGTVDEQALVDLIEFQIRNGINGLVPCGTTGESATLGFTEHKNIIDITVKTVAGRVPIIAGAGANSTLEAIEFSQSAQKSGAGAVLSVVPYYNKPNQEGIYHHFKAIAESLDIPVILYNVPGRTAVNMSPETVARLAEIDNIIGIKEACGSLEQISDIIRLCPKDFILLSGDDFTAMPTLSIGGKGVISVVSNLHPRAVVNMCASISSGDLQTARTIHYDLFPLMKCMFLNPSPAPVKRGLQLMGLLDDASTRPPITPVDSRTLEELEKAMTELKLI